MKVNCWEPTPEFIQASRLSKFINKINNSYSLELKTFDDIHQWSVCNIPQFWDEASKFLNIKFSKAPEVIISQSEEMINTRWFKCATLNYAENLLSNQSDEVAIYEVNELGLQETITWVQLYNKVAIWVNYFNGLGIKKGDVIAGILPNNSTAIISMLAATSLGAVWSSCSPDFGENAICDRLEQVQPKCVISVSNYIYKGKEITINDRLSSIKKRLANTKLWINVSDSKLDGWISSSEIYQTPFREINFVPCSFQDPLFILFSSGTTGKPKCIVHGVGGTLLQHKKEHQLHCNLTKLDRLFYYTTCGWMMWNWMVSALASDVALVIYDGAAIHSSATIWDLAEEYNITVFGCSASFIGASQKRKVEFGDKLISTRLILSTGSPLLDHHYDYLYDNFNTPIQVGSISGGTDIISCFALCNPLTPVVKGLIQGLGLGMDVASYIDNKEVKYIKGDLVCKSPAPSMPVYFLNDPKNKRYKDSYFNNPDSQYWYHGDYIIIDENNMVKILGRSDSTLNPGGIRIGTAEFYQILDEFSDIEDCLVSSILAENEEKIVLFVKLASGKSLTSELKKNIRLTLKTNASPRHMPQMICQVNQIPYTTNGKKCEVIVKRVLRGESILERDTSLLNSQSLDEYSLFFKTLELS